MNKLKNDKVLINKLKIVNRLGWGIYLIRIYIFIYQYSILNHCVLTTNKNNKRIM